MYLHPAPRVQRPTSKKAQRAGCWPEDDEVGARAAGEAAAATLRSQAAWLRSCWMRETCRRITSKRLAYDNRSSRVHCCASTIKDEEVERDDNNI